MCREMPCGRATSRSAGHSSSGMSQGRSSRAGSKKPEVMRTATSIPGTARVAYRPPVPRTAGQGVGVRRVRPAGWWFDALLVGVFVLLTSALWAGALLGVDTAVRDWCDAHRPDVLRWPAMAGNLLG